MGTVDAIHIEVCLGIADDGLGARIEADIAASASDDVRQVGVNRAHMADTDVRIGELARANAIEEVSLVCFRV